MMRKASIQLSVNFLVVMIICLVLLGIGFKLISDFVKTGENLEKGMSDYKKSQLQRILSSGALVASYPRTITISRGDTADFSLGISNELGKDESFVIKVEEYPNNPVTPEPIKTLYFPGPYPIKNNEQTFTIIRIMTPKNTFHGTYIFDVYVCNTTIPGECSRYYTHRYGEIQKLQVDVK